MLRGWSLIGASKNASVVDSGVAIVIDDELDFIAMCCAEHCRVGHVVGPERGVEDDVSVDKFPQCLCRCTSDIKGATASNASLIDIGKVTPS